MKHKKLLLSLLAVTMLNSCAGQVGGLKVGKEVLNGTIIENNFEKEEKVEEKVNTLIKSKVGEQTFKEEEIVYRSGPLLVTRNELGYIGFYSLLHQKYIIASQYEEKHVKYSVITDPTIGFVLNVTYKGKINIYDSMGNILYSGDEKLNVTYDFEEYNETIYFTISSEVYEGSDYYEQKYYKYKANGDIQEIEDIEQDVLDNIPTNEVDEEENEFPFGSKYNEIYSLEEFGLKGYISASGNLLTLYDANKQKINTYNLPTNSKASAVITNKFYYQIATEVSPDSKDYDIYIPQSSGYIQGRKYKIETHYINLENGKEGTENVKFIIGESSPYKGEDGENYSILSMQLINKDKTLGDFVTYLIDSKGVLHDRVDNISINSFEKTGDNYLNKDTNILYDAQLNEIAYLDNINPTYDEDSGYIYGKLDGKYGLLDTDAKVVLEFTADSIVSTIVDDKVITYRDGVYYRNDLLTGKEETLGITLQSLGNGAYMTYDEDYTYFHNAAKEIYSLSRENLYNAEYNTVHYEFNNASYLIIDATYKETMQEWNDITNEYDEVSHQSQTFVTIDINKLPQADSLETIGTEKTEEINYHDTLKTAAAITLGKNEVPGYKQEVMYYSFEPEVTGYYTLSEDFLESSYIDVYKDESYLTTMTRLYNYADSKYEHTYLFEEGKTYNLRLSYASSPMSYTQYEFNFELEKGDNSDYPLIYSDNNKTVLTNSNSYAYIRFIPEFDGKYTVTIPEGYVYIDYNYFYPGESVYLCAGETYNIEYYSRNYEEEMDISFDLVAANQSDGMSFVSAVSVSSDSLNPTTSNLYYEYGNYFKYKNTSSKAKFVKLITKSDYYASGKYNVYNSEYELINSYNLSINNSELYAVVNAGDTVYFEVDLNDNSSYDAKLHVELIDIQDKTLESNVQYDVSDTKVFKKTFTSSYEVITYSFESTYSTNVMLFDSKGMLIDSNNRSSYTSNLYKITPYETYYLLVLGRTNNNITFRYDKVDVSNLSLSQLDDYLYEKTLYTNDTIMYKYTNDTGKKITVTAVIRPSDYYGSQYYSMSKNYPTSASSTLSASRSSTFTLEDGECIYINIDNRNSNYRLDYVIQVYENI